jgi:hypothetical protein
MKPRAAPPSAPRRTRAGAARAAGAMTPREADHTACRTAFRLLLQLAAAVDFPLAGDGDDCILPHFQRDQLAPAQLWLLINAVLLLVAGVPQALSVEDAPAAIDRAPAQGAALGGVRADGSVGLSAYHAIAGARRAARRDEDAQRAPLVRMCVGKLVRGCRFSCVFARRWRRG